MARETKRFGRRLWLRGAGGVVLGLPILEAFSDRSAKAQAAPPPFLALVIGGNGVVQARSGEAEAFWPTTTGALTTASLQADRAGRAIGELSAYGDKLLVVRGINHAIGGNGCNHASANAQILTAATLLDTGNKTRAAGESVDTTIAKAVNQAGVEPLFLHAGMYSAGGSGFAIPSYVSYVGSGQQRTGIASPLRAYQRIVGTTSTTPSDQTLLAARRKSVNDLVRAQMQRLLARPELTASDHQRLDQHFTSIRDLEVQIDRTLPADKVTAMTSVDARPYDMVNHETIQQLHMDLMVFAISSGYTRVAVLQVGDREDDHQYTLNGATVHFHDASHRRLTNSVALCTQIDRIQANHYKYLLDQLSAVTTPAGPLLDQGVAVWTNQLGTGPDHSMNKLPYVMAGTAQGYLAKGRFLDLGSVPNARMLNTLAAAAGVPNVAMGGQSGVLTQMLA